jgi:predicted transcriptional regulator
MDFIASFWELPLWIQVTYLSIIAITILGLFKLMPLVSGRLKHALENPKTRDIFYFIQRNPGVTIAELSEEQKINRGTLKYHLSQLLSNNKIIFIRKGKFSRLFYNTLSPMDKESIVSRHLKNENSSRILFKIMDNPGISNQELSDGFRLAKSTTHEYLKNFSDDGLVEFRQDGKFKRCYLNQDARMIMLRYRPQ